MRPRIRWASWRLPHQAGLVFGQDAQGDALRHWAVIDVELARPDRGIKLHLPHLVTRQPKPRHGAPAIAHIMRSHGAHAILVIHSPDAESVIDLVAALDPTSAERLHQAWRQDTGATP